MSSDVTGRRTASNRTAQARIGVPVTTELGDPCTDAPAEVLEFIRYCYQRRGFGWPELYDEMCAAAARGSYRGMDYDALAALGIGFSLKELPRLAALSHRIVAEERAGRLAAERRVVPVVEDVQEPAATTAQDEVIRVRAAMIAASAG